MGTFLIKRWECIVNGHAPVTILAASRGKARAKAWRSYTNAFNCTFKRFIQISTVRRDHATPAHFGAPITVSGAPAFFIAHAGGNSLKFALPDSDGVSLTHELDASLPWLTTENKDADIPE